MGLKTRVKTANITNLSDARYCAGMGVDFLGFPIHEASATSDLKLFSDIRSWISGPATVLEVVDKIMAISFADELTSYNADFIQINASDLDNSLLPVAIPLIITLDLADLGTYQAILLEKKARIGYLVIHSQDPLSKRRDQINLIGSQFSVLVRIKDADNDLAGILELKVAGIELSGSPEDKPGLKGYEHLSDILDRLEE